MFRLEKVFQNDGNGFILFSDSIKSVILLVVTYIFTILIDNSIYDLSDYTIYTRSNFFIYSIFLSLTYFILSLFLKNEKEHKKNFLSFLKGDILNIFFSVIFSLAIIFIFQVDFKLEIEFIYLIIFQVIGLFFTKLFFNNLYNKLIDNNIIQKNIMHKIHWICCVKKNIFNKRSKEIGNSKKQKSLPKISNTFVRS